MPTVRDLLTSAIAELTAAGSETPRLDAEVLLAHSIGIERTGLIAHPDAQVGPEAASSFRAGMERRALGEPVAYIRGFKEFYGIALGADRRALIPRPETELLVDLAESEIVRRLTSAPRPAGAPPLRAIDVGTGSGTIAVTLAVLLRRRGIEATDVELLATDLSADALTLARENGVGHGVADRIGFLEADLFPPSVGAVDLVLANLPYVRSEAIPGLPVAASFEPRAALDGGPDGLDVIRRLLAQLPDALGPGGVALLEIGSDQGETIVDAVASTLTGWTCRVERDLGGQPRVARVERAPASVAASLARGAR